MLDGNPEKGQARTTSDRGRYGAALLGRRGMLVGVAGLGLESGFQPSHFSPAMTAPKSSMDVRRLILALLPAMTHNFPRPPHLPERGEAASARRLASGDADRRLAVPSWFAFLEVTPTWTVAGMLSSTPATVSNPSRLPPSRRVPRQGPRDQLKRYPSLRTRPHPRTRVPSPDLHQSRPRPQLPCPTLFGSQGRETRVALRGLRPRNASPTSR